MKRITLRFLISVLLIFAIVLLIPSCDIIDDLLDGIISSDENSNEIPQVDLDSIPEFTEYPYVIINNNVPFFTQEEIVSESYEYYGARPQAPASPEYRGNSRGSACSGRSFQRW